MQGFQGNIQANGSQIGIGGPVDSKKLVSLES